MKKHHITEKIKYNTATKHGQKNDHSQFWKTLNSQCVSSFPVSKERK